MDAQRLKREQQISNDLFKFKQTKHEPSEQSSQAQKPPERPQPKQHRLKWLRKKSSTLTKSVKKVASTPTGQQCLKIAGIVVAVFFGLSAILGLLMTCLLVWQRDLFFPTYSITTTTKVSGAVTYNVGQLCQWTNQCLNNAYCAGTCQCSDDYYFDSVSGACKPGGTLNAAGTVASACQFDYECNKVQRLTCINNKCGCEVDYLVWDGTYSGGSGIITGRCRLREGQGQSAAAAGTCLTNFVTGTDYGSASTVCECSLTAGVLDFSSGYCITPTLTAGRACDNSLECPTAYSACMFIDGDSYTKCTTLPTYYYLGGVYNLKSLIRYGEACATAAECVPTAAGMVCSASYTGSGTNVCRCSAADYYDPYQEACMKLKSYNQVCRDNAECADAYDTLGYCGFIPGGGLSVCRCIYNYYGKVGGYCKQAINVGSACSNALTQPQCEYNSYCSGGQCTCGSISYQNANGSCLYKGYSGDPCTTGTGCWSGTCTANACT